MCKMKHSVDRKSQEKRLGKTVYVKIVNGLKLLSAFLDYLDFVEETDHERHFDLKAVLVINVVDKTKGQKKEREGEKK